MATTAIGADSASENPKETIRRLSTEIQTFQHRVLSLARAIDDATEGLYGELSDEQRSAVGRIVDFSAMIDQNAVDIGALAEQVEIETGRIAR